MVTLDSVESHIGWSTTIVCSAGSVDIYTSMEFGITLSTCKVRFQPPTDQKLDESSKHS